MFLIQTYDVEDCWKYINSVSSTTSYNLDLPSEFTVSAIVNRKSNTSSTASLHMGTDLSNRVVTGIKSSDGTIGLLVQKNGSFVVNTGSQKCDLNTDTPFTYTYQNGVSTITWSKETVTDSTNQIIPTKLLQIEELTNVEIKEIKIKPL